MGFRDQRPSSRSEADPPGYPFDSPFGELGTVGPSHSSRLVCEALPNVENVPIFHARPFATMSCIEGAKQSEGRG